MIKEDVDDDFLVTNVAITKEVSENKPTLQIEIKSLLNLKKHINLLQTKPDDALTNIITGHVAPDRVNVDDALVIGDRMAAEFTAGLPQGFHIPLKKNVITMEVAKKGLKIQDALNIT